MNIHVLWAMVMSFSAVMYTIFDGFDLGVGILLPFVKDKRHRDIMVDSITPVWDGNETWIILMGVGLLGGFPNAYSLLLPALYLPIIIMVISLALRGVSMEYRFISVHYKSFWDFAFSGGSVMASFCQGIILGNLMEGIVQSNNEAHLIPAFLFITPFTLLTGITLVVTYALIGANWLNFKTTGFLQQRFKIIAKKIIIVLIVLLVVIIYGRFNFSIFSPRFGVFGIQKIFSWPSLAWYVISGFLLWGIFWSLNKKADWLPFGLNIILTLISAIYIVTGFWPYIVPPNLTIYDAGAPLFGNSVLLYSSFIIMPVILTYIIYSYTIFKGKVTGEDKYDPEENFDALLIKQSSSINGRVINQPSIHLSWVIRIAIAIIGMAFFFLVIGFLGDFSALLAILIFISGFTISWWLTSKKSN